MKQILANKRLYLLMMLALMTSVQAQERLYDLTINHRLSDFEKYIRSSKYTASRAAGDTLDLPFFDDFSEPFSRLRNLGDDYPNPDLWIGNKVYINNHYAVNPISQGVATFDGLDEQGRAYGFGFSLPSASDTLKSKPLKLAGLPADSSVFLSFYYQPQGLGNAPEEEDILVVQFKDTADDWTTVLELEGENLEDFEFKRAMVAVTDSAYLFDGFQFQFVNYASRSGSVDHWHVDYIELDDGRSLADTIIDDVAFMAQTSRTGSFGLESSFTNSLLNEFNSMPLEHYWVSDSNEFMIDSIEFQFRNNTDTTQRVNVIYRVLNENLTTVYESPQTGVDVFSGLVCGTEFQDCNNDPFTNLRNSLDGYHFANQGMLNTDSTFYVVEVEFPPDTIPDAVGSNDKFVFKQELYNYYAYDDGTAESAYGLGELENVGRVAVKYTPKNTSVDYVRAIQLYLNPVEYDLSQEPVQLVIWDGGAEPGDTLWTSETLFLNYTDHVNYFYHYKVERDVPIQPGQNVWVGWIQQPATNQKFSVGFDKRTDNSDKVFYNLGTIWNQSSIPGSVMIRPVFGEPYDWVGVEDGDAIHELMIYPNPSTGVVHIQEELPGQLSDASIQVFDVSGRSVHAQFGLQGALQLSSLTKGTYILQVETEKVFFTKRLILQ